MIVCSCNVLTDHDVRDAVNGAEDLPRNAKQIYGCLGCSAECGRCARTIKTIIEEALGACAKACCTGCPHSQAHADSLGHDQAALAAAAAWKSPNLLNLCALLPFRQKGCSRLDSSLEAF
jgi:bacterioferritin-associated ferredoxin